MEFLIALRLCRVLWLENILNHQQDAFSFMGNAKLGLYFAKKALKSNVWYYSLFLYIYRESTYIYTRTYTHTHTHTLWRKQVLTGKDRTREIKRDGYQSLVFLG